MQRVNSTTFRQVLKDSPSDNIVVEVGDAKQPDFKPQFKVSQWDNEVNFSIRAEEQAGAEVEEENGVIKYRTDKIEVHQYSMESGENGGFEFEWVLKEKPTTNILTTTIQSKGLDFLYQPALTKKQIDKGLVRPDNVIGSYAVYHQTKTGNTDDKAYKTGKAFHIYRPKAKDAIGQEVWCELNITGDILTVKVPQSYLNTAVYPVVVDPTFGFTSIGASQFPLADTSTALGNKLTSPSDVGTVQSLNAYCFTDSSQQVKGFIVNSSGSVVTNGVGTGQTTTGSGSWITSTLSVNPTLTASTDYGLLFISNDLMTIYYDDDVASWALFDDANSYTTPNSIPMTEFDDYKFSLYATYTAGSSTNIKTVIGLAKASVKTIDNLAIADVKTWNNLS